MTWNKDGSFDILRFHGLLIHRRTRLVKTTNSHHWLKKYPNLIAGMAVTSPEQLWVSDITYIRTGTLPGRNNKKAMETIF